ncbi:WD40-repeat-containing domain protein [Helicostylum pulchrum]|uniref:Uncharacterized protein n=1 Tax=Helicostylum pulchrum TaxID=562976 RepID=A0ABP9YH55_9FUNG|nr:WD40-repeat-containing domain protein [Helicostylum pulchrum]
MTIAEQDILPAGELSSFNFNQDYSCISVSDKNEYRIYNCDPFAKCYSKLEEDISITEMLFCTSLVALVGASPRRLRINNTKRETTICELTFHTPILSVKMNRKRLIVVLEEQIFIYDISNMKLLHTIDTIPNPSAIVALSPSSENCYIACQPLRSTADYYAQSSQQSVGDIEIYDANAMKLANIVQAHKSPISCISMNAEGTLLVTASEKGTVIRVFAIPSADKVYQFRRGSYSAKIYSMSFNLVSTLLCVSSDTETVHIFKLADADISNHENMDEAPPLKRRSSLQRGMNFLIPDRISDIWESSRHFASLKLPNAGVRSLVALSSTTPQVLVITSEGYFYQYNIDLENGGECVLLKQSSLL